MVFGAVGLIKVSQNFSEFNTHQGEMWIAGQSGTEFGGSLGEMAARVSNQALNIKCAVGRKRALQWKLMQHLFGCIYIACPQQSDENANAVVFICGLIGLDVLGSNSGFGFGLHWRDSYCAKK